MIVTERELNESLARLEAACERPEAGLFGPGSTVWRSAREAIVFAGGGRAALLQLAHPFVAHAVDQHSRTRVDTLGRFVRTFDNVFAMTFGDLPSALRSARRVHAIHRRIRGTIPEDVGPFRAGTPYEANDAASLMWVHATLTETSIEVHELLVGALSPAEKELNYQESKRFAALFGIPESVQPETFADFEAYCARMYAPGSPLAVGAAARDLAGFLLRPPRPALAPAFKLYAILTAGLLPPRLRDAFGLPFGRRERALFRATVRALRAARRALPPALRYLPAYHEALQRLDPGAPARRPERWAWDRFLHLGKRLVFPPPAA